MPVICLHHVAIIILCMQAAERGQYEVAALLVAARPDLVNVRDKRDLSAIDLVKTPDDKWSVLLTP